MPTKPPTFRPGHLPSQEQQRRDYDARRGNSRYRGYTTEWDKVSRAFKYSHPLCLGCEAVGRITPTEITDHIIPHKGDGALRWAQDNWQPACAWHHCSVKQKLETLYVAGLISADDLRLNSAKAVELSKQLGEVGLDGWPLG